MLFIAEECLNCSEINLDTMINLFVGKTVHVDRTAVAWYMTPISPVITVEIRGVTEFKKAETLICREIENKILARVIGIRHDGDRDVEFEFYVIRDRTQIREKKGELFFCC